MSGISLTNYMYIPDLALIFIFCKSLFCCSFYFCMLAIRKNLTFVSKILSLLVSGNADRIWTSGSKWAASKYLWCPSGIALLPSLNYYASGGGSTPAAYLLSLGCSNNSGTITMSYVDEQPSRPAMAMCEEP
jgi:hypothetical protein